ncbi:uncharacterized mitochondrial protein AtMg00810-like [Benincasa hispida]|uniref:uncharacterized mitochondrial protein AtMg00810-like n=1 Tax=Benincasa hispida TaxID=102211 RepID=UPI00190270ED|nr:uncharacterized mitochondrial protein AtMg00810-like [Benincasa hispida]
MAYLSLKKSTPETCLRRYARNMLKKFSLNKAGFKRTPVPIHAKLPQDHDAANVDDNVYRCMIGSLLYLTASYPDINYAVGVCARYQGNPKTSHLTSVKRILKYINGTVDYGLFYSSNSNGGLVGYCYND